MLPELRTFIQRAEAHRQSLDALLDAIPSDFFTRRGPGDEWTARQHVQHLATIETFLISDFRRLARGEATVCVGGTADHAEFERRRVETMAELDSEPLDALRSRMRHNRRTTAAVVASLLPRHLEAALLIPGRVDAWGQPVAISAREYLAAWPEHDVHHAAAIRRAITTAPDLSAVLLGRKRTP